MSVPKRAHIIKDENFKFDMNSPYMSGINNELKKILTEHANAKDFNSCVYIEEQFSSDSTTSNRKINLIVFESGRATRLNVINGRLETDAYMGSNGFKVTDSFNDYIKISIPANNAYTPNGNVTVDYISSPINWEIKFNSYLNVIFFTTLCPENIQGFLGWYPNHGRIKESVNIVRSFFNLKTFCNGEITNPQNPWPPISNGGEQVDSSDCSNTGQFGGGGKPLKDIKLFLYANKVTKGTVTLRRPQVEVGTYATDWRPNPADATKSIEMMLKQIESVRKGGRKNGKKRD